MNTIISNTLITFLYFILFIFITIIYISFITGCFIMCRECYLNIKKSNNENNNKTYIV